MLTELGLIVVEYHPMPDGAVVVTAAARVSHIVKVDGKSGCIAEHMTVQSPGHRITDPKWDMIAGAYTRRYRVEQAQLEILFTKLRALGLQESEPRAWREGTNFVRTRASFYVARLEHGNESNSQPG